MPRSLYLDASHKITEDLSTDEIAAVLKSGEGVLWIDIRESDGDHSLLESVFNFHPLTIEDCYNGSVDTPKIDDYGDYLFIVSQCVLYFSRAERLELAEVDIFLGKNYVVTSRQKRVEPVDQLFNRACDNQYIVNRGTDFLAHTILDSMVDLLLPAVEAMDEHIDELEQRILTKPDKALLQDVLLLKRNTMGLRRSILPERDLVNRLSRGEFGALVRSEALVFYRDVYDHIVRVDEMLDGLRDLADGVLNSYLSAVNNRMNEIMKTFSVVAVVFLPLTLIASIFGTNLDYSPFGLTFHAGFWLMLASMVVTTATLILYFRHRGWF